MDTSYMSRSRHTVAEILAAPDNYEPWAVDTALWVRDQVSRPAPKLGRPGALCPYVPTAVERNTLTIVASDQPPQPRQALADVLLDEAGWLAEELGRTPVGRRVWVAHIVVFTQLGSAADVLAEVRAHVRPRLLRAGINVGEFFHDSPDTSVRNRHHLVGRSPWPCFALRVFMPQDETFFRMTPDSEVGYLARGVGDRS